ncbi:MAG TPA: SRPBCC family protein, partial [Conexibacter sp.]|nr:SRPBCC family protein [Conexibacter sp.]
EITNDFTISLPPERTFELLVDLERVAPCMPGAELGDELPDGSRAVKVHVKLGPMKFVYDGSVRVAEQDAAAQRAVLVGTAKEARGQGDANATITMQVRPGDGGGSAVSTNAQVDLSGRAAQMGHGVVQAVSKQLMGQMTRTLEQRFAGSAESEPAAPAAPAAAAEPESASVTPLKSAPKASRPAPTPASPTPTPPPAGASRPGAPPAPAAPPVKAGALMVAVVRDWLRRLFRRKR